MSGLSNRRVIMPALALAASGLMLAACAQEPAASSSTSAPAAASSAASSAAARASSAAGSASAAPASSAAAALDECSKENLTLINPGTLTIGTAPDERQELLEHGRRGRNLRALQHRGRRAHPFEHEPGVGRRVEIGRQQIDRAVFVLGREQERRRIVEGLEQLGTAGISTAR